MLVDDDEQGEWESGRETLFIMSSGRWTLTAETPIPDFAIPYAAPKTENTKLTQQPMAPKKLCQPLVKLSREGSDKIDVQRRRDY